MRRKKKRGVGSVPGRRQVPRGLERTQCIIRLETPLWERMDGLADDLEFSLNFLINEAIAEFLENKHLL